MQIKLPQERCSILLPRTVLSDSANRIHIQMERQSRNDKKVARRFWLHIDGHQKINLKLEEDYPPVSWKTGRALIAETTKPDGLIARRYMARFRTKGEASRDIIVVFELEIDGFQRQTRSHMMTSSRDTDLGDLFQNFLYIRPEALGKQTASNGMLTVGVTVNEEQVAQENMFVIRLAPVSSSPEAPVDAAFELDNLNLRLDFLRILETEDQANQETKRLHQQREAGISTLDQMRKRLAAKEEQLRRLNEEMKSLCEGIERETQRVDRATNGLNVAIQVQNKCAEQGSKIQQRLDEWETEEGPGNWFETTIQTLVNVEKAGGNLDRAEDLDSDHPPSFRAAESGPIMHNETPILWAARTGREAVARLLLEKGANFEANDVYRITPLHLAAAHGHETVARLLLEKGANVEGHDENGNTPLHLAAGNGHETAARLLLEKGANVEANNNYGNTPLHLAASNGHEAIPTLLLNRGANIEAKNDNGDAPLIHAVAIGHETVARLLLEHGANIEANDEDGNMPIHWAASNGHEAVSRLLLEKGANIDAKNKWHLTALRYALVNNHRAVAELLIKKGAREGE